MNYKSEISGAATALLRFAQQVQLMIEEGWEEQDTMLTPAQVKEVGSKMAEAKRWITKAQEAFKKFEGVAEARKTTSV